MSVKALNDYVGALMLAGLIAVVSSVVMGRESDARLDERISSLERIMQQQLQINDSVNRLSEAVAVLQDRGERK